VTRESAETRIFTQIYPGSFDELLVKDSLNCEGTEMLLSEGEAKMQDLKQLRSMADWTQMRTARASGIHRAKLSMAETGELELAPAEAAAVRRVLLAAIRERADRIHAVLSDGGNEPVHATTQI
jgi:DNA-binding XRE family transcriptional regulator